MYVLSIMSRTSCPLFHVILSIKTFLPFIVQQNYTNLVLSFYTVYVCYILIILYCSVLQALDPITFTKSAHTKIIFHPRNINLESVPYFENIFIVQYNYTMLSHALKHMYSFSNRFDRKVV
jgi:hypothetical protein